MTTLQPYSNVQPSAQPTETQMSSYLENQNTVLGEVQTHTASTSNPHSVTKSQVGLGSVANTGDSDTPVSGGTTKFTTGGAYTELAKKVDVAQGSANAGKALVVGSDGDVTLGAGGFTIRQW